MPRSCGNSGLTTAPDQPPEGAGIRRLAHRFRDVGVLAIEGSERAAFLQGQLTQEVEGLLPGGSRLAAGLTPKGKLLYFGRLVAEPEGFLVVLERAAAAAALAHLSKYAAFQKVSVRDASTERVVLGLYGPDAARIEVPAGALRLPPHGELSGEILAPSSARGELDVLLRAAGSVALSEEAAEILRVEAGRPRLGQDADASNLPDEVGLQEAVAANKGCYVGQEVVARLRTYGRVNRRLVGFRFPKARIPAGTSFPSPEKPGHELGRVSSSVLSPRFGAIGLGLLFREVREGATLAASGAPDRIAVVAALPFA